MNNTSEVLINDRAPNHITKKKLGKFVKKDITGWLILLPSLILFCFFIWEPILYGIKLSLSNTVGYAATGFAGLKNYFDVFSDPTFASALSNTVGYTFWSILIGYLVPIILAIILNEVVHFKSFFRFALYFPNMVPAMASLMLWGFLFDPGPGGLLNSILSGFGLPISQWLNDARYTIPLLVVVMTWRSFGATVLIYTASLQGVNQELYEAASLDGAGIWSRIKYITIPSIFNIARLLLIMQIISVFQVFYEPMVMTSGGPNNASISLMLLNYNYAFISTEAGKSAAVGVIVSAILLILTVVYLKISKENEMV